MSVIYDAGVDEGAEGGEAVVQSQQIPCRRTGVGSAAGSIDPCKWQLGEPTYKSIKVSTKLSKEK